MKNVRTNGYFTRKELGLWLGSVAIVLISFMLFDREQYLILLASLVGVTSLIFNARGNPVGPLLMVVFSLLYGVISLSFSYYGELITYLGMTLPMSVLALISWLKNPFQGNAMEVEVYHLRKEELLHMGWLTVGVTVAFYFVLKLFHTAYLIPSTLSVATSFAAVYLTFRRSPYYAVGYAANDVILIILWSLAAMENMSYISVVVCFAVFLVNDIYGFISWHRMGQRQLVCE